MHAFPEYTPEIVRRAVEDIIAAKPSYRDLITFYGCIFAAQEEARSRLQVSAIELPEHLARTKRREQMPLVMASEMVFDAEGAGKLLSELCRIAVECGSELAGTARRLTDRLASVQALLRPFIREEEAAIFSAAEEIGIH